MHQFSESRFADLNEKKRACEANSGLVNRGGGLGIDTQADLPHGRRMVWLLGGVWPVLPGRVARTLIEYVRGTA
jgi:hypothetical protein